MISLREQIESGKLVCPKSRKPLVFDETNSSLITADGVTKYPVLDGNVPVLFTDTEWVKSYLSSSPSPTAEVSSNDINAVFNKLKKRFVKDHRSASSDAAIRNVIADAPANAFCLAIGGGPGRIFPDVINLNIEPLPSVDVVADAHCLPYADDCVDAIFCEAVLEHLYDPQLAVTEMKRVLRPGGKVMAITPFLQPYHGYPHHYQNFTLRGHARLFESKGFEISESGTCVGPTFALVVMTYNYINTYLPFGKFLSKIYALAGLLVTPLDKIINRNPDSHILASTTYLVATKR
jgi:SAM-dependent methyltransferase